jgi:hypothetical protein
MAEPSALSSSSSPRSRVVRSLARAAQRPCARPGCPAPARATLTFVYARREALLDRLSETKDPQAYDLCAAHAARTEAPRGWGYVDVRPDDDRAPIEPVAPPRRDLGSDATVAVLAAALRAVPDPPAPPAGDVAEPPSRATTAPAAPVAVPGSSEPAAAEAPRAEPAAPLPTPRRVPAAGDRGPTGPATDW